MKTPNLTKAIDELARAVNAANRAVYAEMVADGHSNPTRNYFSLHETRPALTAWMTSKSKKFGVQ